MTNYRLKQTPKTKFLNFFRTFFTLPLFEKLLVSVTINSNSKFIQKLIPPNYLYKKDSFRHVTRKGIKYNLDISNVVDHYLFYGIEDSSYKPVLRELKKAKVILDIGANIGTTSLFFASINPNAQIISFEPHPDTFKRAVENIKLNNFQNIDLINIGLGEKKERLKLYEVNENNPGMNRIIAEDKDLPFKQIDIEMLDVIMLERGISKVDFIKIDVEGFEYSVLQGGKEIIKSKPMLFLELDDNNLKENNKSAKELIDLLLSFGYKEFYRADNSMPITTHDEFYNCHYDIIVK